MKKSALEYAFENIPLPFCVISISLHGIGIFLLTSLKTRRNQDVIILNLSIAELIMSCCEMAQNILHHVYPVSSLAVSYLTVAQCTLFVFTSFLIMIVLTLDRFLETFLNLKYVCYINKTTTRRCLFVCWLSGWTCGSVLLPLRYYHDKNIATVIFKYIFPITEGIFLITAAACYSYIYAKFRKLNYQPFQGKPEFYGHQARTKYRKKKFFPPFLIMISFVLFVVLPDIANLLLFYVFKNGITLHSNILSTFYVLGFICDAVIYVFLQKHVRKQFYRIFRMKIVPITSDISLRNNNRLPKSSETHQRPAILSYTEDDKVRNSRRKASLGSHNEFYIYTE